MKYIHISGNLYIAEDVAFGAFDRAIVFDILQSVDENFSQWLGAEPYSTCPCLIAYREDGPECCALASYNMIYLSTSDDYWCQWLYQFAHEYCHHLINGRFSDEIRGLVWFEESICELSSMCHLYQLALDWERSRQEAKTRFVPSLRKYLESLLPPSASVRPLQSRWLHKWGNALAEPCYHRELYRGIAAKMFPLFLQNPSLWKIILHFGDMQRWESLPALFAHLTQAADDTYSESLRSLRQTLFF